MQSNRTHNMKERQNSDELRICPLQGASGKEGISIMKKIIAVLLTTALLLGTTACAPSGTKTTPPPSASAPSGSPEQKTQNPSEIQIGVLIPGSPTNGGFCEQGANGADLIRNMGYKVSLVEAVTAEEIKSEAENMASEGYKIVFGHGGQCDTPFSEVSPDYPDTWFVVTGGNIITANQFPFYVAQEETAYLMGMIAGMMTKSGTVAFNLDGDFPAYTVLTNAYQLAAETVNPEVKTLSVLLSAATSSEGYETTLNQISAGADMIYSNTNEAQSGAMKAAEESEGVYIFGNADDFSSVAPNSCLVSMITHYTVGFEKVVQLLMSGEPFEPEIVFVSMKDGGSKLCWNEKLQDQVPAEVMEAVEKATQEIYDGTLHVPTAYDIGSDYQIGQVIRP